MNKLVESVFLVLLLIESINSDSVKNSTELTTEDLVIKDGDVVDVKIPETMTNPSKSNKVKKKRHMKVRKDNFDAEELANKLIDDFKINFNGTKTDTRNRNNTRTIKDRRASKRIGKKPEDLDKNIQSWSKKVFSRPHKPHRDFNGKPVKYFKDDSIPIMFRKVIPPSERPLPVLNFKYHENGKKCKCQCKL